MNWLLSREGQTIYTRFSQLHTARVDVDISLVDPDKVRNPAIKYYDVISEEYIETIRPKYEALILDIFSPLLK